MAEVQNEDVPRDSSRTLQRSFDTFGVKVDSSLERLTQKVDLLIESVIRLNVNEKYDKEILEKQAAGLLDLSNRQTLTDREIGKIITDLAVLTQAVNDLKDSIQADKAEMEKRTSANRFLIGMLFTAAASINVVINFFSQHFKP